MEKLKVFFNQALAGELALSENRLFSFSYASDWLNSTDAFAFSVSLPLQKEPFSDQAARSFFANLLPESAVKELIARLLGVSEKNDFILLKHLGGECAGALSILPDGLLPDSPDKYAYRPLSEGQMASLIKDIPKRPLLAGEEGIRLSLAGAQDKLPLCFMDDQFYIPLTSAPSNCILKPGIPNVPSSIENECFCMVLAGHMDLNVPDVHIIRKDNQKALFIERYDRVTKGGVVTRLHQEDFCQALGCSHELKYESEGGPGFKMAFGLVREYSANPVKDVQQLLKWVFFNTLIGNMDAHAKNLSLLYDSRKIRLAPFYDILCTNIYEGLSKKLAMKIGSENRPEWLMARHWEWLAEDNHIRPKVMMTELSNFCQTLLANIDNTFSFFSDMYGRDAIVEKVVSRAKKTAQLVLGRVA